MNRLIKFRVWLRPVNGEDKMIYNVIHPGIQYDEADKHAPVLMQFTGLLDKNGKEICEGDVLKVRTFIEEVFGETEMVTIVEWDEFGARFVCRNAHTKHCYSFWQTPIALREIIGNIFENSELLERKE